jgi:hypothetical protein
MTNFSKFTRILAVAAFVSGSTTTVFAQGDAGAIIKGGIEDANTLMNGYMGPLMKSFGAGLNSGWYQTAKPHGIGGFDITFSANVTFAPSSDLTYTLDGLKKIKPAAGQPNTAPTIFGDSKAGPTVEVRDKSPFTGNDTAITSFALPSGLGTNIFAVPTAQLCVGVGFGTDVSVRFVPTLSTGDVGVGLFGFAVKHDFKQWIPGMKDLPFDLSAMFGYTTMNADVKLSVEPDVDADTYQPDPNKKYNNQKAEFKSKAWTANVIISKKLGPFTPYLGVGYQNAKTTLAMVGDYPITVPNDDVITPGPSAGYYKTTMDVTDPIKIEGKLSGLRANAGFRLKLAVLTIHADYTLGKYNVASVGLGLNLQSIVPFKL